MLIFRFRTRQQPLKTAPQSPSTRRRPPNSPPPSPAQPLTASPLLRPPDPLNTRGHRPHDPHRHEYLPHRIARSICGHQSGQINAHLLVMQICISIKQHISASIMMRICPSIKTGNHRHSSEPPGGGRVSLPGSHRVSLLHARTGTRSGRAVHNQPVTSAPGSAPRGAHPSGGQRAMPPRGPLGLRDFSQHPHNRAAQLIDTPARARRYRVPDPPPTPSPRSWHRAIGSSRRCSPTSMPHSRATQPQGDRCHLVISAAASTTP